MVVNIIYNYINCFNVNDFFIIGWWEILFIIISILFIIISIVSM